MPKRVMKLQEMRCTGCGKLLAKIHIIEGTVERKCPCGKINTVTITKEEQPSKPYQERIPGKIDK